MVESGIAGPRVPTLSEVVVNAGLSGDEHCFEDLELEFWG